MTYPSVRSEMGTCGSVAGKFCVAASTSSRTRILPPNTAKRSRSPRLTSKVPAPESDSMKARRSAGYSASSGRYPVGVFKTPMTPTIASKDRSAAMAIGRPGSTPTVSNA